MCALPWGRPSCHRSDAPDLTDDGFKIGWVGKTVGQRFRNIRIAMPADAPGSLDSQTYIDIVAYILQIQRNAARQSETDAGGRGLGKDRHRGALISSGAFSMLQGDGASFI